MASIFDTENYEALNKRLPELTGIQKAAGLFYSGDHWQESRGWIGPQPEGTDGMPNGKLMLELLRGFISKNAIKEGTDRHVAAVLGREPYWSVGLTRALKKITNGAGEEVDEEPSKEEKDLIGEADNGLVNWWDRQKALITLALATKHAQAVGRGPLRPFVPRRKMKTDTETGVVGLPTDIGTLDEAIKLIFLQAPPPESAIVATDDES